LIAGKANNVMKRATYTNRNGFTLVELMIVIAVIGILASISLPSYQKYREEATCKTMASDARNVASAALSYSMCTGDWDVALAEIQNVFHPSSISGIDATVSFGLNAEGSGTIQVSHPQCSTPFTFCQSNGRVVRGEDCG